MSTRHYRFRYSVMTTDRGCVGLLLLKVPNLVALAVGYWGLVRLAPRLHLDASYLKWLWLASPVVVAVSLIQGQLDIMPAAITVWAMVFFKEDRPWASLVCLGLAAGFKDYALLLIPITALYLGGRDILKVLAYGVVGALPFLAIVAPFVGHAFLTRAVYVTAGERLLSPLDIGVRAVHLWLSAYLAALVYAWVAGLNRKVGEDDALWGLIYLWLIALTTVYLFATWLPRFALWLMPMAVVLAAKNRWMTGAWLANNALLMLTNLVVFAHNLDGSVLAPLFRHAPVISLASLVPGRVIDAVYTATWGSFAVVGVVAWNAIRRQSATVVQDLAWYVPLPLAGYIAIMVLQHV